MAPGQGVGLFLWLTMVLGARRDELVALRWGHVDLDGGQVSIRLLIRHRRFCIDLLELTDTPLGPDHLVFSGPPDLLRQRQPNSMTSR